MFNFFNIKPKYINIGGMNVADINISLIQKQLAISNIKPEALIDNNWSLGYIYGNQIAQLNTHYGQLDGLDRSMAIRVATTRLFGLFDEDGLPLSNTIYELFKFLTNNNDAFLEGVEVGMADYQSSIKANINNSQPMALYKHLYEIECLFNSGGYLGIDISLIQKQLEMAYVKPGELINDKWSLGYIFGSQIAQFIFYGLDISQCEAALSRTTKE